jgi:hypothetical protein
MPRNKVSQEAEDIDRQVCAEATCCSCGHTGLRYIPRWNERGGYAPVSKCPKCKEEVEF